MQSLNVKNAKQRPYIHLVVLAVFFVFWLFSFSYVYAGNIVPENEDARFLDDDSLINFGLAQGDVTVTDSEVTGYAWAEDWGWINLQPPSSGVVNDGDGNLSGYAWGETLGWVNFDPTHGGVSIDGDGFFSGYAWAENGGWIVFSCEVDGTCSNLDHRVQTTWSGEEGDGGNPGQIGPNYPEEESDPVDDSVGEPSTEDEEPSTDETPPDPPIAPEDPGNPDEESDDDTSDDTEDDTSDESGGGGEDSEPSDDGETDEEEGVADGDDPESSFGENIGDILATVRETAEKIMDMPYVQSATNALVAVGGMAAASSTAVAFLSPITFTELTFVPIRLWYFILAIFGLRKKRLPWGTVYDSVTKQPLDPAYVQLMDTSTGKEVEGIITDLDGRYGFLPQEGEYTLKARKTNYKFPSERLQGKSADVLYSNLYFGEEIPANTENRAIIHNIPLDPVGVDWNEVQKREKKLFHFYSKHDVFFYTITTTLFYIGFFLSIAMALFFPSVLHAVILVVYVLLVGFRAVTGAPQKLGSVYDENNEPLSYGLVKVFLAGGEQQVKKIVTNEYGKFYSLLTPGSYYVKIYRRVGEEEFEEVYTSSEFKTENGLIDKKFIVGN